MILIRPRAWWFNKVPLSILLFLLCIDGKPLNGQAVMALLGLIAIVCCVANYGYALNEVFDLAEDRRGGRKNAAAEMSRARMLAIVICSAALPCILAAWLAGSAGLILTCCELLLPLAYSIPPLRLKERGWLGVSADATAAHVYPAVLALIIVSKQGSRFAFAAILWAAATGLRGILSHQLQSEEHDRDAGLLTVVHRIGHARIKAFVVFIILPVEIIAFAALLIQSDAQVTFRIIACIFVLYECAKFGLNVFPVIVFQKAGERYVPFVDEGFYKVWGPLALAIDAAFVDLRYLLLLPLYVYAFRPRVSWERVQIAMTAKAAWARLVHAFHPGKSVTRPVG